MGLTINHSSQQRGCTALHLATRRRHIGISLLLLHNGTNMDAVDQVNETPLHAACREGLLPVVQTMCAFGCDVETVNKVRNFGVLNKILKIRLCFVIVLISGPWIKYVLPGYVFMVIIPLIIYII